MAYNIQFSGQQEIFVKAKDPTKPKVVDIVSYLEAWNVFFEATVAFHPHMVTELLGYQKMISEYAALFKPQAWLAYDRARRQARAVNKAKPWDVRDDKAYQHFMRDIHALPPCYMCGRPGHFVNTCPQWERNYGPRSEYQAAQRTVRQPSPYHYYAPSVAQPAVAPHPKNSTKPESTTCKCKSAISLSQGSPSHRIWSTVLCSL